MTKKKGGGGGGQYHLPKHLRNSGKGSGGGGKGSGSSSSSTTSSSTTSGGQVSNVGEMSAFQLTQEVLYKLSPEQLVERAASLIRKSTHNILEEGETLYLRYVYLEPDEAMKKKM